MRWTKGQDFIAVLRLAFDRFRAPEKLPTSRQLRMGMQRPPLWPDRTPVKVLRRRIQRKATDLS
jgi:hypothetical protein